MVFLSSSIVSDFDARLELYRACERRRCVPTAEGHIALRHSLHTTTLKSGRNSKTSISGNRRLTTRAGNEGDLFLNRDFNGFRNDGMEPGIFTTTRAHAHLTTLNRRVLLACALTTAPSRIVTRNQYILEWLRADYSQTVRPGSH